MKVRAKGEQGQVAGYYGHFRRRGGDVFTLENDKHFSEKWMEKMPDSEPETKPTTVKRFGEIGKVEGAVSQADPSQSVI